MFERTYPANASSFVVSTALIKVTISANESLSASADNKIASILPFSVDNAASFEVSYADKSPATPSMLPCNVLSAAILAAFSVDNAASFEVSYADKSPATPSMLPCNVLSAAILAAFSVDNAASFEVSYADKSPATPSMLPCNVLSADSLAAFSVEISVESSPSTLVKSELVADISAAKATSKESTDASKSPEVPSN